MRSPRPSPSLKPEEPELRGGSAALRSHSRGVARVASAPPESKCWLCALLFYSQAIGSTRSPYPHFQTTEEQAARATNQMLAVRNSAEEH